jgi:hypothetical protein
MNKGIGLARGAWLAHLHAGDELLPGALELVERALRVTSADVVCAPILKLEEGCETVYRPHPANLPLDMTVHHPGVWTRREVLAATGGFDESYALAMDYELFLRLFVAGRRFEVMAEPVARMAGAGISERSAWATLRETHRARRRLLDRGLSRTRPYLLYLVLRLGTRRALQRAGLGRLVACYRRRFALAPKS